MQLSFLMPRTCQQYRQQPTWWSLEYLARWCILPIAQTTLQSFVTCSMWHLQVTPSSKVVGDLAQFMVQNDLDEAQLVEKASNLNLPDRSTLIQLHCMFTAIATSWYLGSYVHVMTPDQLLMWGPLTTTSMVSVFKVGCPCACISIYGPQPGYMSGWTCEGYGCAVWLSSYKGTWGSQQVVSLSPSPAE